MTEITHQSNKRRYSIGFSIVGSLLIIGFLAFINYSNGSRFPWFIYPSYAVLWWPIVTLLAGRNLGKMLSLVGSLITIALLFMTNYLTSWSYPWFLFPSFAILWWPISVFLAPRNCKLFSIIASAVLIAFFVTTNYITTPSVLWFYYPLFAVIWWPLSVFFAKPKTIKAYSILGALIIIAFLTFESISKSPNCPWALFTYFPVLMWPVSVLLGRRFSKLLTALAGSFVGILYYLILNMTVFKGFPWVIFPTYALLWWPLAVAFARRGREMIFSIAGFLLSAAFFIAVNRITSPFTVWSFYPIFALAWWPLAVYYFVYRRRLI
jgi:hypothetical protein